MDQFWDPLRKKAVSATPEEKVRQWFISVLRDSMKVPEHMMMSEVGFKFGEKQYRADILVYGRNGSPLAIVECKRPDVQLDAKVVRQAMRYDMVLSVRFIFITNGPSTLSFRREGGTFMPCTTLPDWESMQAWTEDHL